MKSTLRRAGLVSRALILGGLCAVVVAPSVRADQDDQKKNEEDLKKAEKQQQGQPGGQPGQPGMGGPLGEENPLLKILELMKNVEDRLFESDTGDFTQTEQKKIVEAMRFEDKTSEALEELIRKIEEQAKQQSSSSSSSSSEEQQKQQQQKNETEQQKQERQRREQEKQRREQQEEAQRRAQQQQSQNQQQDQQNQQKPQSDQTPQGQQERQEGRPPDDPNRGDPRDPQGADRWGQLPEKLHQPAANAQNQDPPSKFRELIERYRARLASPNPR